MTQNTLRCIFLLVVLATIGMCRSAHGQKRAASTTTTKPFVFWWWMGNRVSEKGIEQNLDSLASIGYGGVHIIPIYGKKGEKHIALLSDSFNLMVRHTVAQARERNMWVDMSLGSGWPYGGPNIPDTLRAQQLMPMVDSVRWPRTTWRVVAHYTSTDKKTWSIATDTMVQAPYKMTMVQKPTYQQVKRAAPGGAGYVIDHFNPAALTYYAQRWQPLMALLTQAGGLRAIYMDSYEVFGANYGHNLLEKFWRTYAYDPLPYLPYLFYETDHAPAVKFRTQYNQLLHHRLMAFCRALAAQAQGWGVELRLQAHGAPANIIDLYETASIPETEAFGTKADAIIGYEPDPNYDAQRYGQPDYFCMKLATTTRHETAAALVSSETGTWLTEHFREDPAALKIRVDELFLAGINHIGFHGATYQSPTDSFPGRRFYATLHTGPHGHMFRKMKPLNEYVRRCQQLLQGSTIKAEVLVLFDAIENWTTLAPAARKVHMQETHFAQQWMAKAIQAGQLLRANSIPFRYISPAQLKALKYRKHNYKVLIIPAYTVLDSTTQASLTNGSLKHIQVHQLEQSKDAVIPSAILKLCYRPRFKGNGLEVLTVLKHDQEQYFIVNTNRSDSIFTLWLPANKYIINFPAADDSWQLLPGTSNGTQNIFLPSGASCIIKPIIDLVYKGEVAASTYTIPHYHSNITPQKWTIRSANLEPINTVQNNNLTAFQPDLAKPETYIPLYYDAYINYHGTEGIALKMHQVNLTARIFLNNQPINEIWAHPKSCYINHKYLRQGSNHMRIQIWPHDWNRIINHEKKTPNWKSFDDINMVNIRYQPFQVADSSYMKVGMQGVEVWQIKSGQHPHAKPNRSSKK